MSEKKSSDKEIEKPIVAKTAADLQRLKLLKLMKNPVRYFNVVLLLRKEDKTLGHLLISYIFDA